MIVFLSPYRHDICAFPSFRSRLGVFLCLFLWQSVLLYKCQDIKQTLCIVVNVYFVKVELFIVLLCYVYPSEQTCIYTKIKRLKQCFIILLCYMTLDVATTVCPKKYAHGFVVPCFVVVMQSFIINSHEVFIHIHQGCFAGTGAIVRLPQCQWSRPDGYGKISQCITTTKHSKAKTVCIFLGIHCTVLAVVIVAIWFQCKQELLQCNVNSMFSCEETIIKRYDSRESVYPYNRNSCSGKTVCLFWNNPRLIWTFWIRYYLPYSKIIDPWQMQL